MDHERCISVRYLDLAAKVGLDMLGHIFEGQNLPFIQSIVSFSCEPPVISQPNATVHTRILEDNFKRCLQLILIEKIELVSNFCQPILYVLIEKVGNF